jgi:hypothetical protein
MTSGVKPIHQLGGSTFVTVGSFATWSFVGFCVTFCAAALTEGERISAQHKMKSGTENER